MTQSFWFEAINLSSSITTNKAEHINNASFFENQYAGESFQQSDLYRI
jgi:hypothetical protein